jgi:hypothetical protein
VFGGLSWGVQLEWKQVSNDDTAWILDLKILVRTVTGGGLPGGCAVGAGLEVEVGGEPPRRTRRCWVARTHGPQYADVLCGGLRSWPAADRFLPQRIQGGKLRGSLVVKEVL